jgi:hypothetical protein
MLSDEQLELALDEQSVSGRRLGEILVRRGIIAHSTLSLALAEQYGIHASVESGFGTGLRALLTVRPDVEPEVAVAAIEEPEPPGLSYLEQRLEEQWARLASVQEELAAAEQRLDALDRLHMRRRAQVLRLLERFRTQGPQTRPTMRDGGGHLLFVQLGGGYELLERNGRTPAPDERLELDDFPDTTFVVTSLGRSPLPNDSRACAFAQPL